MLKIKSFIVLFMSVFCFAQISLADINKENAITMVENLTQKGIEEVINSNAPIEEKNRIFKKLFTENLDLDFIGRYVLGRYWRTATPQQKKEFISLYKEFNVKTWSKRFDEFKGKSFVFEGTTSASNPKQVFVNTKVPMPEGAPVSVKWRVYENKGKLKIIDIIIENVSLAQTARNEYTVFISKSPKGIDGLLENLREKVK
jgi:phospholipid transport system substrate-binding protein